MSPRIVDRFKRKNDIAMAALNAMAEYGFHGATMHGIAGAAGLSKASIYDYFDSREDVLAYAVKFWIRMREQAAKPSLDSNDDPETQLRAFTAAVIDSFLADKQTVKITCSVFHLLLGEQRYSGLANDMRDAVAHVTHTIKAIIEAGARTHAFRPDAVQYAEQIALNMMAFFHGISVYYYTDKIDFDIRKQVTLHMAIFMNSLTGAA